VVSFTLRPLCLREEIPIRKLGGLRIGSGYFREEQRLSYLAANRTPDRPTRSLETILATLYRRDAMGSEDIKQYYDVCRAN